MRLAKALAGGATMLAVLEAAGPARATDAKSLLDMCKSAVFAQECLGYFEGVTDMLHMAPAFAQNICPPKEGLAVGEIIEIFERFAERYPQHLVLTGSEVIGMSLAQAHPCKTE